MAISLTLHAHAKLNLGLAVTGILENGYHQLDMVMQSISLHDTLTLTPRESGVTFSCVQPQSPHTQPQIPAGEENLCVRAVRLLEKHLGRPLPVSLVLEKRIPSQAGMAGGSADGAAVLSGCNRLFSLGLSPKELIALGAKLGADVPFCLAGGTLRVKGIGEQLSPAPPLPPCFIVVAKPEEGVSTLESFARYDQLPEKPCISLEPLVLALESGELPRIGETLCNALEACLASTEIPRLVEEIKGMGALGSRMTGSGSAVFGLFDREEQALLCRDTLSSKVPFVQICRPACQGLDFC